MYVRIGSAILRPKAWHWTGERSFDFRHNIVLFFPERIFHTDESSLNDYHYFPVASNQTTNIRVSREYRCITAIYALGKNIKCHKSTWSRRFLIIKRDTDCIMSPVRRSEIRTHATRFPIVNGRFYKNKTGLEGYVALCRTLDTPLLDGRLEPFWSNRRASGSIHANIIVMLRTVRFRSKSKAKKFAIIIH